MSPLKYLLILEHDNPEKIDDIMKEIANTREIDVYQGAYLSMEWRSYKESMMCATLDHEGFTECAVQTWLRKVIARRCRFTAFRELCYTRADPDCIGEIWL